jgi:tetratricopeptide (TPR) repeat protein
MKKALLFISALLIAGCAAPQKSPPAARTPGQAVEDLLVEGYKLLNDGQRALAIKQFNKAIAQCESAYEGKQVYASRGMTETIYYMAMAAAAKQDAIAVDSTCADALYLRAYAGLDSGELELAEEYIRRAIAMSPANAWYLSELGHIHHLKRDWEQALGIFSEAEQYAKDFSPPDVQARELTRAKRGVGYSLIELGRLDEAEAKFMECLEIDRNDKNALNELQYIEKLREEQAQGRSE